MLSLPVLPWELHTESVSPQQGRLSAISVYHTIYQNLFLHNKVDLVLYLYITPYIRVKQVQVSGTRYTKENIVVLGKTEDLPVLGRISQIFITQDDQCLFVAQLLLLEFHPHYNAYEIVGTGSTIVTTPDRLHFYHPHNTHTCFSPSLAGSKFVCLKQHLL